MNAESKTFGGDSDKCYICLSPFTEQTVASLENCQHVFCLECILHWSQTASICPVDRLSFGFVHQRRHPGGDIEKKIKVRKQKERVDDEEESDGVICEECGRSDRRHRLLVCLHCDSGYHVDCLTPSLDSDPEADWICPDCVGGPRHADTSIAEEVSDGELTDLLAKAGEIPSTTSRLRPCAVNRPSCSSGQRRSQRIQSRASRSAVPAPNTPWHVPKYLLGATSSAVTTDELNIIHQSDTKNSHVKSNRRQRRLFDSSEVFC